MTWLPHIGTRISGDPEARLVAAAQRRDRAAFDALRRVHEAPLRGFLSRRLGLGSVDDVAQETWLTCWNRLPEFQGRSRFKAWLYGIALHKCQDQYRAQSRSDQEGSLEMIGDVPSPVRIDSAYELRATVQELLAQLPGAQREVLELYYFADLSLPEIAEALPRNLNTVKYQFYQAHERVTQGMKRLDESLAQLDQVFAKENAR